MRTVGDVLKRVREILQDAAGTRYTTEELIAYLNEAVLEVRSIRPDLFVFKFQTGLPEVLDPAEPFPLPDMCFVAVCYYVAGRAELRDDEFAVDGRAMTLMSALTRKLTQGV